MYCRRLWRGMYAVFFRNFWAFSSHAFVFLLWRERAALSSNRQFHLLSLPMLFGQSFFSFFPCNYDNLNKESLHEHRELWQSSSKQKLIKTPAKKFWLMFFSCKLLPHKGAEWWCRPEKAHHGDGDWDVRCLAGNLFYPIICHPSLPCQMAASAFLQDSCRSPRSSMTWVVPYMNVNVNSHAGDGRAKSQHSHRGWSLTLNQGQLILGQLQNQI